MRRSFIRGAFTCALSSASVLALAVPAHAVAQTATVRFDIPATDLATALESFGKQSGKEIIFDRAQAAGKHSAPVSGTHSPGEALSILLKGSGLSMRMANAGTFVVEGSPQGNALAGAPNAGSNEEASSLGEDVPEGEKGIAEILVVGQKSQNVDIRRTQNDPQPYVVFNAEEIKQSGASSVEDFLRSRLTSNTTFTTNSQTNPSIAAGGNSSINLRGLGANETLILVNGRRMAGVTTQAEPGQPDLNGIPVAMIERIEVLAASASAIYGGAAVGGVVNVILRRDYNGGQADYSLGSPLDERSIDQKLSLSYGFSLWGGRTQIMVGAGLSKSSSLLVRDREKIIAQRQAMSIANAPALVSSTVPFSGATPNIVAAPAFSCCPFVISQPNLSFRDGTQLNAPTTFIPEGASPGDDLDAPLLANAGRQNLAFSPGRGLDSLFSTPKTESVSLSIRQKLPLASELFLDLSQLINAAHSRVNPLPQTWFVPASAPTNPFNESVYVNAPTLFRKRFYFRTESRTASVGLIAPVAKSWRLESDFTKSTVRSKFEGGSTDFVSFNNALATGALDPFADLVTHPVSFSSFVVDTKSNVTTSLTDLNVRSSGTIAQLPAGAVNLTTGIGYRREKTSPQEYEQTLNGTPLGSSITYPVSESTKSIYGELRIPLIGRDNAVPLARELEVQLAIRSEWYTTHLPSPVYDFAPPGTHPSPDFFVKTKYNSTNETIGFKYSPVSSVSLRASYATAFLPPTASQLSPDFQPVCSFPCQPITDPANGQSYLVDFLDGGNPNLLPQRSKTWSVGGIFEPKDGYLSGLRLSADWYRIVQPNYITIPTVDDILSDPEFSSRITRDPTTGLITLLDLSAINATRYITSGLDLSFDYDRQFAGGTLYLHAAGTRVLSDRRQYAITTPLLNYLNFPGDGGTPKLKANAIVDWNRSGWHFSWIANYISSYSQKFSPGSPSAILFGPSPTTLQAQGGNKISSQTYYDLYFAYEFGSADHAVVGSAKALQGLTIGGTIRNIFNSTPPYDAANLNYTSTFGDLRLRRIQFFVRKAF